MLWPWNLNKFTKHFHTSGWVLTSNLRGLMSSALLTGSNIQGVSGQAGSTTQVCLPGHPAWRQPRAHCTGKGVGAGDVETKAISRACVLCAD